MNHTNNMLAFDITDKELEGWSDISQEDFANIAGNILDALTRLAYRLKQMIEKAGPSKVKRDIQEGLDIFAKESGFDLTEVERSNRLSFSLAKHVAHKEFTHEAVSEWLSTNKEARKDFLIAVKSDYINMSKNN